MYNRHEDRPLMGWCAMQRGETSPEVWEAVLGCLTQLTTHNGYTVRAFLEGISQKVVAALLHRSVQHCWSQEVYCQLIRIAVNLLYVPQPSQATSDEDDDFDDEAEGWLWVNILHMTFEATRCQCIACYTAMMRGCMGKAESLILTL